MRRIGYARSSRSDSLAKQIEALVDAGVAVPDIYTDHLSTPSRHLAPGLMDAIGSATPGSTIVVTDASRLARSLSEFEIVARLLSSKQVSMASLDGSDPMATMQVLRAFMVNQESAQLADSEVRDLLEATGAADVDHLIRLLQDYLDGDKSAQ